MHYLHKFTLGMLKECQMILKFETISLPVNTQNNIDI